MRKALFMLFLMAASLTVDAQVNFMGSPVDGDTPGMLYELRKKGFKDTPKNYGNDCLVGNFYNRNVLIIVSSDNYTTKVTGVTVFFMEYISDMEGMDKNTTIKLFNELLYDFDEHEDYINMSWMINEEAYSEKIEKGTDLWYNIKYKGFDYHVYYRQLPYTNYNAVHFCIMPDNYHYDKYFILLYYENLKNRSFGSKDL